MWILNYIVSNLWIASKDLFFYVIISPFIIFWVWTILWTTKDISQRTDNLAYQLFSMLLVFIWTPFIGFPLYFIIRPSSKLDDIWWKDAIRTNVIKCFECETYNLSSNKFCVECWNKLKINCKQCWKGYYYWYNYCPECWAPNTDIEEL